MFELPAEAVHDGSSATELLSHPVTHSTAPRLPGSPPTSLLLPGYKLPLKITQILPLNRYVFVYVWFCFGEVGLGLVLAEDVGGRLRRCHQGAVPGFERWRPAAGSSPGEDDPTSPSFTHLQEAICFSKIIYY